MQFWLAPLVALAISILFFLASPKEQGLARRCAASAHGLSIAALFFGAMQFHWSGAFHPAYQRPFGYMALLPLALIVLSFFYFRGAKSFHFLHIFSILCLAWVFFIGSMAVTGNWL